MRFSAWLLPWLLANGLRLEEDVANTSAEDTDVDVSDLNQMSDEELDELLADIAMSVSEDEDEEDNTNPDTDTSTQQELGVSEEEMDRFVDEVLHEADEDDTFYDEEAEHDVDQDQDDEACTFNVTSMQMSDWLTASETASNSACQDFGPRFGTWGRHGCPSSLAEITRDVLAGASKAEGGKSGTKPLISAKFVVKVIDATEHRQLGRLLRKLRGSRRITFIVPTCRNLIFNVNGQLYYLQVALNMRLRGISREPYKKIYDLKGNWAYSNRRAGLREEVWKDGNFKKHFPYGLKLEQVNLPGGHEDRHVYTGDQARDMMAKTFHHDSKMLAGLGLMDYSLMVHVAQFSGHEDVAALNAEKPWAFGVLARKGSEETLLVLSFGVIDYLMHEDHRGALNTLMNGLTFARCEVNDIDPIPAKEYWIRFIRMWGIRLGYGADCVSCLRERRRKGYTYFPNAWSSIKSNKTCKESQ